MKKELYQEINLFKHGAIEASAGTGKTYTIVKLILRILSDENLKQKYNGYISLEEILIVTYTEKATQELLDRIHKGIQKEIYTLKQQQSSNKELIEHFKKCLLEFNNACIFTLHGFCNRIIQNHHFLMQIGSDQDLIQNILFSKREFENLLPKYSQDIYDIFSNEKPSLKKISEDIFTISSIYNPEKDTLKPNLLPEEKTTLEFNFISTIKKIQNQLSIKEKALNLHEAYVFLKDSKWSGLNGHQINANKLEKINSISTLLSYFSEVKIENKSLQDIFNDFKKKNLLEILSDPKDFLEFFSFPNKNISAQDCLEELGKHTKTSLNSIITTIDLLRLDIDYLFHNKEWNSKLNPIFKMVKEIQKNLEKFKKENSLITYNDMILLVEKELQDKNSFVLDKLKNQFLFGMIDEFQDTNLPQWSIFKSIFLTQNNEKQHCLFVVGDPKQSIYSFQGSNLNIYINSIKEIINHEGSLYKLNTNYRSKASMIKGYNLIFKELFKSCILDYESVNSPEKETDSSEKKSKLKLEEPPNIFIQEFFGTYKDNITDWYSSLSQQIVSLVKKETTLNEICILARTNSEITNISKYLRKANIPFFHYKKKGLFQSKQCYHLILLLRSIINPLNLESTKLLFASPFFEIPLEQLETFDLNHPLFNTVWNLHLSYKNKNLQSLFFEIKKLIDSYKEKTKNTNTLRDLIDFIYQNFYQENFNLENTLKKILLSYHQKEDEENEINLYSIPENIPKVQLMTIHASKGLDFSIVFLATTKIKKIKNKKDLFSENSNYHKDFWISSSMPKKVINFINEQQYQEELRLNYVAMTRAKNKLILPCFINEKENCEFLLNHIIKDISKTYPNYFHTSSYKEEKKLEVLEILKDLDLTNPSSSNFKQESSLFSRLQKQTSYSQLTSKTSAILIYDEESLKKEDIDSNISENELLKSKSLLTSGSVTGNMLHDILENFSFKLFENHLSLTEFKKNNTILELIKSKLNKYKLKEDINSIQELLWNTFQGLLTDPFNDQNYFYLKDIKHYIPEMNFCFTFNKQGVPFVKEDFPHFISGYIDLFFQYKDRYYILDWKSNLLDDYSQNKILENMKHHSYDKQILIYSAATHYWLKSNLPNYDYTQHFGGVFYIYLRGMKENQNQSYYKKRHSLEELENLIKTQLKPMLKINA